MQIQYIKKTKKINNKSTIVTKIGVMVAFEKDGKLAFGYSLLNPADVQEIQRKNSEAREKIAELKEKARLGKANIPGSPEILPIFDKTEAIALAKSKASPKVHLDGVLNKRVRLQYHRFVRNAVAAYHIKEYLA